MENGRRIGAGVGGILLASFLAFGAPAKGDLFLNCGGPDRVDGSGRVWANDEAFLAPVHPPTQTTIREGGIDVSLLRDLPPPEEIFRSDRSSGDGLRYAMPVERGVYVVSLYFSENCLACVGAERGGTGCASCARAFGLSVESSSVDLFDPADAALPPEGDGRGRTFVAVERSFAVGVADGVLEIELGVPGPAYLNGLALRFLAPLEGAPIFLRGDANADGRVNIADAISTLGYLFDGAGEASRKAVEGCLDAADANDDGRVDIADPISTLAYLFLGEDPLPPPFPACGADRTDDGLAECIQAPCASQAPESFSAVPGGSDREIYRNRNSFAVRIELEAEDGSPTADSILLCGGEARAIPDGTRIRAAFLVPPGGSVILRCRGEGGSGCPYRAISRARFEERIEIAADGEASVVRGATISDAFLLPLYDAYRRAYFSASPESQQVREGIASDATERLLSLFGVPPEGVRGSFGARTGEPIISQGGRIPALARYDPEEGVWRISVGPEDEAALDGNLGRALQAMIFSSLYLESILGEAELHLEDVTRFVLPEGAILRNGQEIEGLSWEVDFGGGNRSTASVAREGSEVVLREEMIVTRRPPDLLLADSGLPVLIAFADYRRFSIAYLAPPPPRGTPGLRGVEGTAGTAGGGCDVDVLRGYLSCLWNWSSNPQFEKTFSDSGYKVRAEVDLGVLFEARIGWDFDLSWSQGIYLDWFEAWIRANASLSSELEAHASYALSRQWSTLVTNSLYLDFWFHFGIPVWIRLRLEPYASAKIGVDAQLDAYYAASFVTNNRLGVRWDDGWSWIDERSNSASYKDLRIDGAARADLSVGSYFHAFEQPGVELKAYVYDVAGPFVRANPYVWGTISVHPDHGEWSLKGGLTAWGGVQLAGWLRNLLGLGSHGSWNHKFYDWQIQIASGSWEIDIVPPTNPTQVSSSSHAPGGWSRDRTVDVSWSGASDAGSGIAGYSIVWDHGSATIPDLSIETSAERATSPALSDGSWWFHVRAVDNAGIGAEGAVHLGPFRIDTVPPPRPILLEPADKAVVDDATPLFDWSDAFDLGGTTYRLRVWFGDEIPEELAALGGPAGGTVVIAKDGLTESRYQVTSREALSDRTYFWRVQAVDRAGNISTSAIWTFTVDAAP